VGLVTRQQSRRNTKDSISDEPDPKIGSRSHVNQMMTTEGSKRSDSYDNAMLYGRWAVGVIFCPQLFQTNMASISVNVFVRLGTVASGVI
jgi:hypothetical protein